MRRVVFAILLSAATGAWADTPSSIDVSDLWWNPSESGWGLNLAQQGDTAFATLFVYGSDGLAHWYSASSLRRGGSGASLVFSGTLQESTGPAQPGTFDASKVVRRDVGSMQLVTSGDNAAQLTYSVNGVTVQKSVQRLTTKAANASGEYVGFRSATGCGTGTDPLSNNAASLRVLQSPSQFTLISTVLNETCTYVGTPDQRGRITGVKGTFSCSGQTPPGQFEITSMNVTYQGFVAHLTTRTSASCSMDARFAGLSPEGTVAARASADSSDLWWNPDESGWGINFQQQDDIAFATLFTYDANGQPKWYSASDLRVRFVLPGGLASLDGNLYESIGPGITTSFNPAMVSRRAVGLFTATPAPGVPDELNLLYTIDGVQYVKHVKRLTTSGDNPSGTYRGDYAMRNTCSGGGTGIFSEPATFTINVNGAFQMTAVTANQNCTFVGSNEPHGRMFFSRGTYVCTGNLPESGSYRISELEVGQDGMIGQILRGFDSPDNLPFANCVTGGRFAGVRPF